MPMSSAPRGAVGGLAAAILLACLASPAQSQPSHPLQQEFAAAAAGPPGEDGKAPPPGDTVHFANGKSYLTKAAVEVVKRQAAWLAGHPELRVRLECHTDDEVTGAAALVLGDDRCRRVEQILIKGGVSAGRITATSFGSGRPAVAGASTPHQHLLNRRVVTVLMPGD